jgi:methylamine dehydrogenase accessory protein MauD
MDPLAVSNLVLWVAVTALAVTVLALARQIGVLHERVAPMGALMMDTGPKVGDSAPRLDLLGLGGDPVAIGAPAATSTLLFFLSPTCPVCRKLLPLLRSLAQTERKRLKVVLASDGVPAEHQAYRKKQAIADFPYVLSTELGMTFRVAKLPYAVLIDGGGTVRAKGLVNSREQLESLITAQELGVASVQDYLKRAS